MTNTNFPAVPGRVIPGAASPGQPVASSANNFSITLAAEVAASVTVQRNIRKPVVSIIVFTAPVKRTLSRKLTGFLAARGQWSEIPVKAGPFHIVFPGPCQTPRSGGFTVSLSTLSSHLISVFTPFKHPAFPKPRLVVTGAVYHAPFKVVLPSPRVTVSGKDYYGHFTITVPALRVSLTGTITRKGPLAISLWCGPQGAGPHFAGLRFEEEIFAAAPQDLTPARWSTGVVTSQWVSDVLGKEWSVAFTQIEISHLSTQYVLVPIQATKSGVPYNPTVDQVQFAFMPNNVQVPQNTDWISGSWDTDSSNIIYPYSAKCLIGPSGSINLILGTYVIYVKITDSPEIPVLTAGQLVIT